MKTRKKTSLQNISDSKIDKILAIARRLNADEYRGHDITSGNSLDDVLKELSFYLKNHVSTGEKINQIIEHITKLSTGDFSVVLPISKEQNELDVICMGLNTFSEELKDNAVSIQAFDEVFNSFNSPFFIINLEDKIITKFNRSTLDFFNYTLHNRYQIPISDILDKNLIKMIGSIHWIKNKTTTIQRSFNNEKGNWVVNLSKLDAVYYQKSSIAVFISDVTDEFKHQQEIKNVIIRTIVDTQEEERIRFAKDMHDSIGQQLSAVKFYLGTLADTNKDIKFDSLLLKSNLAINQIQSELRSICFNLMPQTLESFGLINAINELCRKNEFNGLIEFHISSSESFPTLIRPLRIAIFRIVQEFIHNAIKHGNAKKIYMKFTNEPRNIHIKLIDNGKGFSVSKINSFKGSGLMNIRSRIQAYNGEIKISSSKNKGTEFDMLIPIN